MQAEFGTMMVFLEPLDEVFSFELVDALVLERSCVIQVDC